MIFTVDLILYGPLARYGPGEDDSVCDRQTVELADGSRLADLLERFHIPTEERGVTFINGQLTAMPGVQPDLERTLQDRDRIALFHLKSMWPFQYRHGATVDPNLQATLDGLTHSPANREPAEG